MRSTTEVTLVLAQTVLYDIVVSVFWFNDAKHGQRTTPPHFCSGKNEFSINEKVRHLKINSWEMNTLDDTCALQSLSFFRL